MATPPKKPFIHENMDNVLINKINNASLIKKNDIEVKENSQKKHLDCNLEQEKLENTENNPTKKKKKKKKKKTRCYHCNTKLKIVNFGCKCQPDYRFCTKCKMPEYHDCPINWKQKYRETLNKTLPKIVFDKLESI